MCFERGVKEELLARAQALCVTYGLSELSEVSEGSEVTEVSEGSE